MKKMMMTLIAMLTFTVSASAMSYEQARNEALFLTDKMAYELNLTDEQYEAAYEINLDYLMGVTGRNDVFGIYWERRNLDLSYILLDWQWNAYMAASYFYRPLYWEAGYWHFGIYLRYPHRDYFYFGRPHFYATYRGGHAWHIHGTHGYYYGRRDHFRTPSRSHFGMHDRWDRGDFRNHRNSSTRVIGGRSNGPSRSHDRMNRSLPSRSHDRMNRSMPSRGSNRNFEGSRTNSAPSRSFNNNSTPSRSFNNNSAPSRSFNNNSTPSRSFGNSHSSAPSRSNAMPSHSNAAPSHSNAAPTRSSSGSFSGGHSSSSHSSGSHGGGSHSSGGGHFGGRR